MASKTDKILKELKKQSPRQTPIASEMIIPNHSGDHSKGSVRETPQEATDIPNKAYVDAQIVALGLPLSHTNSGEITDVGTNTHAQIDTHIAATTAHGNSGTNTGDQTSIVGITGTKAQFNTAMTDADFATLTGTETLTNKSLEDVNIVAGENITLLGANTIYLADDDPQALAIYQGLNEYLRITTTNGTENIVVNKTINGTTIPTSKTLVVTTDKLSVHAATTSAELAGVISDETGSGALVFGTTPTIATPVINGAVTGTFTHASIPTLGIRINTEQRNQTSAITRSGTTATYTYNSHGFANGDYVRIMNATQTDYNGWFVISNVQTNTFDYTVANNPTTPSTGTSKIAISLDTSRSWGLSLLNNISYNTTGRYTVTFTNTQADVNYMVLGMAGETIVADRNTSLNIFTTTSVDIYRFNAPGTALDGKYNSYVFYGII